MRLFSRLALAFVLAASANAAFALDPSVAITFAGETRFPTATTFNGTQVGGLSGIAYDASNNSYYAVADDRSQINPARFYTLGIDLSGNSLGDGDVTFTGVTTLTRPDGTAFPIFESDPEDIVIDPAGGGVWMSSEGDTTRFNSTSNPAFQPFINRYDLSGANAGRQNTALAIPSKFLINATGVGSGVRNNLAFESLTITPDNTTLVTATENALGQDGAAAAVGVSSNSRILTYNLATQTAGAEFVYNVAPVVENPNPSGAFATNGLVDLLALSSTRFLSVERSFSTGASGTGGTGNIIRIFEIDTTGATDVSGIADLDAFVGAIVPVQKTLLFDLNSISAPGFAADNIEGIAFGENFADGSRSLILVSDNNFSPTQFTQFAAFKVTVVPEAGTGALLLPGLLSLAGAIALARPHTGAVRRK
ncbi:MAG: esterase-like activity of phytase family protein [Armatimonadetes bacterium]|nr:esterase-like activity of phytase family protein [Armatimonadota bacterium]